MMVSQLLLSSLIGAQQHDKEPDIYDRIAHLLSGIRAMHADAQSIQPAGNSGWESINFEDDFHAYDVQVVESGDSSFVLTASLDPFDDAISSHLTYRFQVVAGGRNKVQIDNAIFEDEGMLYYDDSLLIDIHGQNTLTDLDIAYLGSRLNVFRTLGLKANFQEVSHHDAAEALLIVHGRDNDSLRYSGRVSLLHTLRLLSADTHVYAIPTRIDLWQDHMVAQYYVVISDWDQNTHHYLHVTDYCTRGNERPMCDRTEAHMYPFIQRDHLHPDMVSKDSK